MLKYFKNHLESTYPFLNNKRLLIAISGGLDSVVLTNLCYRSKFDFALAHCNFKLRGEESDGDEAFVRDLAKDYEVEVFVNKFDTKAYAEEEKVSIQVACRDLRYTWFKRLSNKYDFDYILTAHHLDDNLETFLINLSRGTGIEGLLGMPERNDNIIRPLLTCKREVIMEYAQEHQLKWREDSSNAQTKYLRNKLRHNIIPELKSINEHFLRNFQMTIDHLSGSAEILKNHVQEYKSVLFQKENGILKVPVVQLTNLNPRKAYLYLFFKDYGVTEWRNIEDLLFSQSGKQIFTATHRIVKDREYIFISQIDEKNVPSKEIKIDKGVKEIKIPISLKITEVKNITEKNDNIIYVDGGKVKFPLYLRKWVEGDYFYPFGMEGKKKLSKFFKDEKYSLLDKENQWLLCEQDDIIWVVGKRADNRYKVTNKTKVILKIQTD
ncbi:tRNA lysidine(34) synthetase TilS [Zhouia sp. PK063]|uniref:tRNA lysidine(34) synthetase TilS n=1 Tax=Zhouia sp. PK063 TaxID=3373602 RepID=UPI0037B3102C